MFWMRNKEVNCLVRTFIERPGSESHLVDELKISDADPKSIEIIQDM